MPPGKKREAGAMVTRIHDSAILTAQGGLVDPPLLARTQGILSQPASGRQVYLRWQCAPEAGLPSEPFKVWKRPATPFAIPHPIAFSMNAVAPTTFIDFDEPLAAVSIRVNRVAAGPVTIALLNGGPDLGSIIALQTRTLGANASATLEFNAPMITGVMVLNAASVDQVAGLTIKEVAAAGDWTLVETVGLPVDPAGWAASGQRHGIKQGLVGAELPAVDAAVDRFKRGVLPFGWWPTMPFSVAAPAWAMPDPGRLIDEAGLELLPMLRDTSVLPPNQQAAKIFSFPIPPPQKPNGETMDGDPGQADVLPILLLGMAARSNPHMAVALGFGTGHPEVDIPPQILGSVALFGNAGQSDWDWLITGLWDRGLDGVSAPVEYAALVPRPAIAQPAPTPADVAADFQAHLRPDTVDGPWAATVRTSWERFPTLQLASVASFAAARHRAGDPAPAEALLARRANTDGYVPIGNTRNDKDPEPTRQSATDSGLAIPNAPGVLGMLYAVATQNIFGIWSPWVASPIGISQPEPATVQILAADLSAGQVPPGQVCPGTLTLEISVDWRVRSVARVELRGRQFAAPTRSTPPPAAADPAGLQKTLATAPITADTVVIAFTGDVPSLAGGTIVALDAEGSQEVPPGPAQTSSRRYRITLPGFAFAFATPHIGLRLEARLIERIAPQRAGAWSPTAKITYVSDTRAMPAPPDVVPLTSLPDAAGECHGHLRWAAVTNAMGYAIYESTETRLRTSHPGLPAPTPDRTLGARLTAIRAAFNQNPLRRDFIRRNGALVTANECDVTLPRGSRDIHLFVIVPVMASGVEGPWPSGANAADALLSYAAPRIATPAPPTIEARIVPARLPLPPHDRVRLAIGTRPAAGAVPKRIDIHRVRVDDAARRLDTMGPPIATLIHGTGDWALSGDGKTIEPILTFDEPGPSWRTVWYRAVAWSERDDLRGLLAGRSDPSPACFVRLPPATPPELTPLTLLPVTDPAWVLLGFSSGAPDFAPHGLKVEATLTDGTILFAVATPLNALPTLMPAIGSGVWQDVAAGPGQYRLLLRRETVRQALTVTVRLSDPLGRTTEQDFAVTTAAPLPSLSPITVVPSGRRGTLIGFTTDASPSATRGDDYHLRVELDFDADPTETFDAPLSRVPTQPEAAAFGGLGTIARQAAPTAGNVVISCRGQPVAVRVRITIADGRTVEQSWRM